MQELLGDIWRLDAEVRVVTTNGQVKKNGEAVMGKGIALQAQKKYPDLTKKLAVNLNQNGNHTYYFPPDIITLPTKEHWRDPSPLWLVKRSLEELVQLSDQHGLQNILLPPPGCGLGGLKWAEIKPWVAKMLDDRFTVVHYQAG